MPQLARLVVVLLFFIYFVIITIIQIRTHVQFFLLKHLTRLATLLPFGSPSFTHFYISTC